jgi:hypothetical protein
MYSDDRGEGMSIRTYKKKGFVKKRKSGSMASVSDVLNRVCESLRFDEKVGEMALLTLWKDQLQRVMGEYAVRSTKAVRIKRSGEQVILQVYVLNASLASELGLLLPDLLQKLNAYSPQTGVLLSHISLTVGGSF